MGCRLVAAFQERSGHEFSFPFDKRRKTACLTVDLLLFLPTEVAGAGRRLLWDYRADQTGGAPQSGEDGLITCPMKRAAPRVPHLHGLDKALFS